MRAFGKACKHFDLIVTHPRSEGESFRSWKTPRGDLLRFSLTKPLSTELMIGTIRGKDQNLTRIFPNHDLAFQVRDYSCGHPKREI